MTVPPITIPAGTALGAFNLPTLSIPSVTVPPITIPAGTTVGGFTLPTIHTPLISTPQISIGGFSTPGIATQANSGVINLPTFSLNGITITNLVVFIPNNITALQTNMPGVFPQIGGFANTPPAFINTGTITVGGG
ncbi:hypothetical protein, partial [Corallococcus sp. AB049A]|uniref:hypothetical protein n=1 Tax=Corallococcus sp. AB049A TaxID=2316721 RepID=UPI001F41C406